MHIYASSLVNQQLPVDLLITQRQEWSKTFIDFSGFNEFRESAESVKHELGSILRSCFVHEYCWHCGSILISYTRAGRLEPF